jgi:tripartite-type tricarboxylate transporter receptor subunit TctC
VKDFAIAMISVSPFVLIGRRDGADDGFCRARQSQARLAEHASAGTGTLAHLAGELFKNKAGIEVRTYPAGAAPNR